jgi:hypothetical protein
VMPLTLRLMYVAARPQTLALAIAAIIQGQSGHVVGSGHVDVSSGACPYTEPCSVPAEHRDPAPRIKNKRQRAPSVCARGTFSASEREVAAGAYRMHPTRHTLPYLTM